MTNHTIAIVLIFTILMLALVMIIRSSRDYYNGDEVEIETVITTTISNEYSYPQHLIHGDLISKLEGGQRYVMDPVDGDKVWLNSNDDMYEDGAGKIWRLI